MDGKFIALIMCASGTAFAGTWLLMSRDPAAAAEAPRTAEVAMVDQAGKVVSFASCEEVRMANQAPLMAGRPGYTRDLDPDADGIACPPY